MIFREKIKYNIRNWKNIFKDEPCFILGNGPSLIDHDLSLIKDTFSIGINRCFKVFIPTILIWQDDSIYEDCLNDLLYLPCAKITTFENNKNNYFTNFYLEKGKWKFNKRTDILYGGGCTMSLSFQLAVAMGASSLILIGCDGIYRKNKTNFYGENKYHTPNSLNSFQKSLEWLRSESPIPVRNCGDNPLWKQEKLSDVLKEIKPKKINHLIRINKLL